MILLSLKQTRQLRFGSLYLSAIAVDSRRVEPRRHIVLEYLVTDELCRWSVASLRQGRVVLPLLAALG